MAIDAAGSTGVETGTAGSLALPRPQLLHVLLVEDSENDALLLEIGLRRAGYAPACRRVDTQGLMTVALEERSWDVVIADYVMPEFGALDALALVKSRGLDLPFIIVSGHISDDTAVAAMKAGAHDYVMKDNLARLGPAVQREMREAAVRNERRLEELRAAAEHGITRILAAAGSLDEAVPLVIEQLLACLEADLGQFWVLDQSRGVLVPRAAKWRPLGERLKPFVEAVRHSQFAAGAGLPGRVWMAGEALWIANLEAEARFDRRLAALEAGLRGVTAFPIQSGGTFFGVLEFFSPHPLDPARIPMNMLTAVSSEIGQFALRRQAEEDLRRARDELEARVVERTAQLRAANTRLQAAMADRKRLEHELLEITEKERRRIGLDLHDDLGQKLAGIALMAKGLELKLAKSNFGEAREAAKISQLVQEAISHAKDLAHDLATFDLQQPDLAAALKDLAARARELFRITCRFKSPETLPPLDSGTINQLYKIAQEALTNAIKHGKAKTASIELSRRTDELVLTVRNSGRPFPDLQGKTTGMGLRIMDYRAHVVGASVDVRANGSRGTIVTCRLPLKPDD